MGSAHLAAKQPEFTAGAVWRRPVFLSPIALLLYIPAAFLIFFFVLPLVQMLVYSFYRYDPVAIIGHEPTLSNYAAILTQPYAQGIVVRTILLSLATTVLSIVLALPIAIQMGRARGLGKLLIAVIVLTPIIVSPIVLAFPWLILLAPNSGLLTKAFVALGLAPPKVMFTSFGVLIGLWYSGFSFMVLSIHTSLENVEPSLIQAAAVHGARPDQIFRRITIPLILPGIASGSLLVFSVSASSFVMPHMLGGNQVPVLATYAYTMATALLNWPSASALAATLLAVTLASMLVYNRWIERLERKLGHVAEDNA